MSEEGFFSRWSRRKRAAEAGLPVEEPAAVESAPDAVAPPPPEEPPLDITTLPPVESLTIESDFAAFLRKEVPEALKRAALRRAWALDPAIRDFIGPADYAWDYNAPDGVPGASLNLAGNLKDLLAQAFGPVGEDAEAAAAPPDPAAPPPPPPPEDPVAIATVQVPVPEPSPEATPPDPAPAATGRRHGSALPS